MRALVTGGNGFIGSAVIKELLDHNYEVWATHREGRSDNIPKHPQLHLVCCDLANMGQLPSILAPLTFDVFYHFAWAGSAGIARTDSRLQLNNVQWTIDALHAAKTLGCARFLCAGSIVEHETMAAAYTQGNMPALAYIYGCGKVAAHAMCMSVATDIGIDLVWPEITNAYGAGERSPRLVNTTIQKCIRGEAPQFTSGMQIYDFVYIDDVARAFRLIGEKGKPFHEYLIGSGHPKPLKSFLLEMQASIAPDIEFKFGDLPFTGVPLSKDKFDCHTTHEDTGFQASISFADGCERTHRWWKSLEEVSV